MTEDVAKSESESRVSVDQRKNKGMWGKRRQSYKGQYQHDVHRPWTGPNSPSMGSPRPCGNEACNISSVHVLADETSPPEASGGWGEYPLYPRWRWEVAHSDVMLQPLQNPEKPNLRIPRV